MLATLSPLRPVVAPALTTLPSNWFLRCYATGGAANARPFLGRYPDVPVDLIRVQSGTSVRLRDYETQRAKGRLSYDLKMQDGKVLAAHESLFIGPNGCSLRPPLSPVLQEVVRNFQGRDVKIYLIKQGTPLPPSLTLVHEHSDHYSMQCVKSMTLNDFNSELTQFMVKHGRVLDKFQFDDEFPFSIQ